MIQLHEQEVNCRGYCRYNNHGVCDHKNPDAVMKRSTIGKGTYLLCKSFEFDLKMGN